MVIRFEIIGSTVKEMDTQKNLENFICMSDGMDGENHATYNKELAAQVRTGIPHSPKKSPNLLLLIIYDEKAKIWTWAASTVHIKITCVRYMFLLQNFSLPGTKACSHGAKNYLTWGVIDATTTNCFFFIINCVLRSRLLLTNKDLRSVVPAREIKEPTTQHVGNTLTNKHLWV